jgi:DNA-binding winged helix-turn-helix (wHTH) protein
MGRGCGSSVGPGLGVVGSSDWRSRPRGRTSRPPESLGIPPSGARPLAAEPRDEKPFRGESFGGEPFAGESFTAGPDTAGRDTERRDPAGWGGAGRGGSQPRNSGRGIAGSDEPGPAVAGADATSPARSWYAPTDGTGTRSSYGPSGATRAPDSYDSVDSTGGTRASTLHESSYDSYDASRPLGAAGSFDAGPAFEFAPPVPAGRPRREPSAGLAESTPDAEPEPVIAEVPPAPGPLVVDRRTRQVWVGDAPVSLTPKEFELLALLTEDPGAVYSRQQILDRVWDPNYQGPTKTLDVHVATLRRKLGNSAWIQTLRGVGFRLAVQNRPPSAGGTVSGATGGAYGEQPGRRNDSSNSSDSSGTPGTLARPGMPGSYGSFESFESFGSSGAHGDFPGGGSHGARPAAFR